MKPIRIKINENGIATAVGSRIKPTIYNVPVIEADYQIRDYPVDFIQDNQKYVISEVDGLVIFTERPRWSEYKTYLFEFDYGENGENTPDEYETWINT